MEENPLSKEETENIEMINLKRFYVVRTKGMPPKDSWMTLADQVTINAEIERDWLNKAKEFRRIRGNFLVGSFEVEFSVDKIISESLFPCIEIPQEVNQSQETPTMQAKSSELLKNLFDKYFLKGGENMLGKKITILSKLSDELPILKELISKDLLDRLRKIMD